MAVRRFQRKAASPPPDTTAPTVPPNATCIGQTSTSVRVIWDASSDNRNVAGYQVEWQGVTDPAVYSQESGYTKQGLTASTSHNARVRAFDSAANYSAWTSNITCNTTAASGGGGGGSLTSPPYPRIAYVAYGYPNNDDTETRRADIARYHVAIIDYWPYMKAGSNRGMDAVNASLADIKARSTRTAWLTANKTQILKYTITEAVGLTINDVPSGPYPEAWNKVNDTNWWVRDAAGNPMRSWYVEAPQRTVNASSACSVDGAGLNWSKWHADYTYNGTYVSNLDGYMLDNFFVAPRIAPGDWTGDGVVESGRDAGPILRAGNIQWSERIQSNMGANKWAMGNADGFYQNYIVAAGTNGPEYDQVLHGVLLEYWTEGPYAEQNYYPTADHIVRYNLAVSRCKNPKFVVVGAQPITGDMHRTVRHGLTYTLLDGGYFGTFAGTVGFFPEEYSFQLGNRVGAIPSAAYQNGVWLAEFDNGISLHNPSENYGAVVNLPNNTATSTTTWYVLRNGGNAWLTEGAAINSLTFPYAREGIILSRTAT